MTIGPDPITRMVWMSSRFGTRPLVGTGFGPNAIRPAAFPLGGGLPRRHVGARHRFASLVALHHLSKPGEEVPRVVGPR